MQLMPGTALHDLDRTDIDTLLPWYLWKVGGMKKSGSEIVIRDGKPYRKVDPKNAAWLTK